MGSDASLLKLISVASNIVHWLVLPFGNECLELAAN